MYTVETYTDKGGRKPFKMWFDSLHSLLQSRILTRLDRLRTGNFGDTKVVGEVVHELRLHFGAGYRIYFGKIGTTIILLLTGGDKSSQAKDIENAKRLFKEFKTRQETSGD